MSRSNIVRTDDTVGFLIFEQFSNVGCVAGITFVDHLNVERCLPSDEGFSKAGGTSVNSARRIGAQDKHETSATGFEQVIGDRVADTTIVDSDQIVIASARIFYVVVIE